jgi:tetratricopeptide (TPR) repeat protein
VAAPEANAPSTEKVETKPAPAPAPEAVGDKSTTGKAVTGKGEDKKQTPLEKKLSLTRRLRKVNRFPEAFAKLEEAQALANDDDARLEVDFTRGQLYFSQAQAIVEKRLEGDDPAAIMANGIKLFERIAREHKDTTEGAGSAYLIGSSYFVLDELAKAMAAYNKSYSEFPKSHLRAKSLMRIGVCQAGLGNATQAARTFRHLSKEFPDKTKDVKKVGKYLQQLGIVGRRAPKITAEEWIYGLVGQDDLHTFSGSVIVVVFFATWCSHCSHNMPRLRGLIEEWQAKGVVFLGVANPNDPMNTEPIDAYIDKQDLHFDDIGLDRDYSSWYHYKVSGLPATALVDRTGVVRWRGNLSFLPPSLLRSLLNE